MAAVILYLLLKNRAGFPVTPAKALALAGLGRPWPPLAALGRPWPAMAGHGRPWPAMVGLGRPWPAMAGHGRPLPALARIGRPRLAKGVYVTWVPWLFAGTVLARKQNTRCHMVF